MERLKYFFEMYCGHCNGSEDIIELINEFKIVQKNERTSGNKGPKFYNLVGFVYGRDGFFTYWRGERHCHV